MVLVDSDLDWCHEIIADITFTWHDNTQITTKLAHFGKTLSTVETFGTLKILLWFRALEFFFSHFARELRTLLKGLRHPWDLRPLVNIHTSALMVVIYLLEGHFIFLLIYKLLDTSTLPLTQTCLFGLCLGPNMFHFSRSILLLTIYWFFKLPLHIKSTNSTSD